MPTHANTTFADLLRHYRGQVGWTQEKLAERAGLSVYGIQKLERGATHPYRDTARRLANALELSAAERDRFLGVVVPVRRWSSVRPDSGNGEIHHNLPQQLTSFVGRQADIAAVTELLATSRLLTLTGTGGVGKTRLALQVASRVSHTFPDSVWLAELAPLTDPGLVPVTVLAAMGIPQPPELPAFESVLQALRTRKVLLVLDNCEHLLEACSALADALLLNCPHVSVLATSRDRWHGHAGRDRRPQAERASMALSVWNVRRSPQRARR